MKRLLIFALVSTCVYAVRSSHGSELIELSQLLANSQTIVVGGLSGDGSTVIWRENLFLPTQRNGRFGYWSRDEGIVPIELPDGFEYYVAHMNVSHDGSVIVGSFLAKDSNGSYHPFRWTQEAGIELLPMPEDVAGATADAVSGDGRVIGGTHYQDGSLRRPWIWDDASGFQYLSDFYHRNSGEPQGVSDLSYDGEVAAVWPRFRWTAETGMISVGDEGTRVGTVSSDGRVLVGTTGYDVLPEWERPRAFRWTESAGMQDLGDLPGHPEEDTRYFAGSTNGDGSTILGYYYPDGQRKDEWPFVWDTLHGMRELSAVLANEYGLESDLLERSSYYTLFISDDGRTLSGNVESGFNPNEMWVAYLDWPLGTVHGDLDLSGSLDVADVDELQGFIRTGQYDSQSDFDFDGAVDGDDLDFWVHEIKKTWFGDANLDGAFNSGDFTQVFLAGQYEDDIDDNSGWAEGDWNADGDFTSGDFVTAFVDGGYEQGPRPAAAVPEPSALCLMLVSGLLLIRSARLTCSSQNANSSVTALFPMSISAGTR